MAVGIERRQIHQLVGELLEGIREEQVRLRLFLSLEDGVQRGGGGGGGGRGWKVGVGGGKEKKGFEERGKEEKGKLRRKR